MTLPLQSLYPDANSPSEKVCTKCGGDPQPLENFHKNKTGRFGRASHCKKCVAEYHKKFLDKKIALAKTLVLPEQKICTKENCSYDGTLQPLASFSKDCSTKDGYRNSCKTCDRARDKIFRETHPEKVKANLQKWYKENTEYAKERSRKWRDEHPEQAKDTKKKYAKTHTKEASAWVAQDRKKHPEKYAKRKKKYMEGTKVSKWATRALKECKRRSVQKGVRFDICEADIMDKKTGELPVFCPIFGNN